MKILFDYQIFLDQEYGGPSRYFVNLAKELILTEDLKICAPLHINAYLKEIPKASISGIKFSNKYIKHFPYKLQMMISRFAFEPLNQRIENKFCNKFNPDIIHKTYYSNNDVKKNATVLTVFDLIQEKFHKQYNKDEKYRPKKKALENADKIICISNNTAKDLVKYYDIDKKKIETVYLANSLPNIKVNSLLHLIPKKSNKDYLLFVGKRIGYKNFLNFVKAFSISKNLKKDFRIICFGNIKFTKSEILEFSKLKLDHENIVHINGNDQLLTSLYKNARALIYPSLYEGFGIPILEAMSLDCPVICSNTSSIPEVGGNAAEYFNPYSIEQMSEVIHKTVYNNFKLKDLAKKGQVQNKKFSWEQCSKNTLKVYNELL